MGMLGGRRTRGSRTNKNALLTLLSALLAVGMAGVQLANPRADTDSLMFVHAVWRHGDRTPSMLIPTDTANNATSWRQGLGELTKLGMSQQYRLGQFLRQRYDGWLAREYSPFQIYLRSSDYNRTLASAQANMAGMFTPLSSEVFVPGLNWRPIPVHTVPKTTDKLLFDTIVCPTVTAEEQRVYASQEVKAIERENEAMLRFIGEKAGLEVPLPLRDVWFVFDPLNSETQHPEDHTLPEWVNATVKAEIWRLFHLSSYYLYETDLMTRLRAGPLFLDILNRMKSVARHEHDQREKFYGYSAHDYSVAGVLAAYGVRPREFPPYSSLVVVELHRTDNDGAEVKLFYKNVTDGTELWEYDIPQCARPCFLADLEAARLSIMPLNWEEECGLYQWFDFSTRAYLFMIGVLIVLCIALVLEIVLLNLRQRRESDKELHRREAAPCEKYLLETEEEEEEELYPYNQNLKC